MLFNVLFKVKNTKFLLIFLCHPFRVEGRPSLTTYYYNHVTPSGFVSICISKVSTQHFRRLSIKSLSSSLFRLFSFSLVHHLGTLIL